VNRGVDVLRGGDLEPLHAAGERHPVGGLDEQCTCVDWMLMWTMRKLVRWKRRDDRPANRQVEMRLA